jgi:hypothetical protein
MRRVLSVDVDQNYDSPDVGSAEAQDHTYNWARLFEVPVELPQVGYFGLTAATGAVSDHHIVKQFLVYKYTDSSRSVVTRRDASDLEVQPQQNKKFIGSDTTHLTHTDDRQEVEKVPPDTTGVCLF